MDLKIVLIGAGSKEFGPATTRDVLLSDVLAKGNVHLELMDINPEELKSHQTYAEEIARKLGRNIKITNTTSLEKALEGANFVITAIEIKRYFYWSQDFHIPRKYGFKQIYGENGGIGGLFHALRNFTPTLEIIRKMEKICPDAWLLNYTNPLTKLSELISRNSKIKFVGLCHGVFQGKKQIAALLDREVNSFKAYASGLNHFSWFHTIEDLDGNDLYPELKKRERNAHWLADWDEIALSRTMLRIYGMFPSPGTNHIGEYVRWASPFLASQKLQYFYDPMNQDPWKQNEVPTYLYNLNTNPTHTEFNPQKPIVAMYPDHGDTDPNEICGSGELAIPIIEGLVFDERHDLGAINISNVESYVPGLPKDAVIEVPAVVAKDNLRALKMPELPTAALALLHTQTSINKLLVEAFMEKSKTKLLQAVLLDPTVDSYQNAVHCINEMCNLQKEVVPEMKW
jgi:alpha-galactosidase